MTSPSGKRIAVVCSHPVQYQTPVFECLTQALELDVYYALPDKALGNGFVNRGTSVRWDVTTHQPISAYYLNNVSRRPSTNHFFGCDTPGIYALLKQGDYDACVVYGWFLKTYWQALYACYRLGLPSLVVTDSHHGSHRRRGLRSRLAWLIRRGILRMVDGIAVPGTLAESFILSHGVKEKKVHRLPHSIDTHRFGRGLSWTIKKRAMVRQRYALKPDAFVIMSCGKLDSNKRLSDLITATAMLPESIRRKTQLLIVGTGPEEQSLVAQADAVSVNAKFVGFCNQRELPTLYNLADCLALCSEFETWGLVVNEAMSAGLPVIVSSAVGSGTDLIQDPHWGMRYPVADTHALSRCLDKMFNQLDQTSDRGALRQDIAQSIASTSPNRVSHRLQQILSELVVSNNPADVRQSRVA